MIFHIVLSLLADHKDMLSCNVVISIFHDTTTLPSMGTSQLDRVIQRVYYYLLYCTISIISSRLSSSSVCVPFFPLASDYYLFLYVPLIMRFLYGTGKQTTTNYRQQNVLLSGAAGNWMDISRQLAAYEVEYHVLQEDIIAS